MLTTERLQISPISGDDIPTFVEYRRDPDVARFQSWEISYSVTDAHALVAGQPASGLPIAGEWVQLGVRVRQGAALTLVGDVAVGADAVQPHTFEIGVTIASHAQRQGYALEAVSAVIDWLMADQGAHRVVLQGDARNHAVLALARRLGMRHEGAAVDGDWFKDEWTTLERFAVLRREWRR